MNAHAPAASLLVQLRELATALAAAQIPFIVIGGLAVNVHGRLRATRGIDLMLACEDAERAHALLSELGYTAIDLRPDLASFVRGSQRTDLLHARRPISRGLLARPRLMSFAGSELPVVSVEGLLGLKIQAFHDDPRRIGDLADMIELVRANRTQLDLDEVRSYFRVFEREDVLDDILRALG